MNLFKILLLTKILLLNKSYLFQTNSHGNPRTNESVDPTTRPTLASSDVLNSSQIATTERGFDIWKREIVTKIQLRVAKDCDTT